MTTTDQAVAQTYIAPQVLALTGCTYRQLDFWCRSGYLRDDATPGSGHRRLFTEAEVDLIYAVVSLLAAGFTVAGAFEVARALTSEDHYRVHVGQIYQLDVTVRDTTQPDAPAEDPTSQEAPA